MISIIVPIYKVEEYLPRCIESILNQTYQDFELILVDDGSPDLSGDICDVYAETDPRIKVIHQENSGISDARNIGLSKATGDYISFIDSDDWVHPEFLQQLLYTIEKYDADIAECGKILTPEYIEPEKLSFDEAEETDTENGADDRKRFDAENGSGDIERSDNGNIIDLTGGRFKNRFKKIHLRRKPGKLIKQKQHLTGRRFIGKRFIGRRSISKQASKIKTGSEATSRFQKVARYLGSHRPKRWNKSQKLSSSWFSVYDAQEALKLMIDDKNFYKHVWNKLYRKSLIEGLVFPAGKLHEDEFWTYQALGRARRVARVNAPMYYYFQRDVSVLGGRFSYEKLDLIEGKWERQKYIDEHYPALSGFARTNLYASMINAGQAILKDLKGNEKKMAVKKIDSYRSKPGISSGMSKESASYQGIWFFLSRISFWGTCRIRNFLKIDA